jgi:hypothetical protein
MQFGGLTLCIGIITAFIAFCNRTEAQVANGDFSAGLTNWTVLQLPDNVPVEGSLTSVDINGNPLRFANEYYCAPGNQGAARALQQTVYLTAGISYDFYADLTEISASDNTGGRVSVYLDSTLIASTLLGSYGSGNDYPNVLYYATLVGSYIPTNTGTEILSITFTRPFEAAYQTPVDYIDNIQLTAEPCSLICPTILIVAADPGHCGAIVNFALPTPIGDCSNAVVTCTPPPGSFFPVGTNSIKCSVLDRHTCSFTVTVEDREPPLAECRPAPNPSGKSIAAAANTLRSSRDPEGFYQLLARDNCDSDPTIYVADSASSFIAGPFHNDDIVKIVQSPGGAPFQRRGPRGVAAHIRLRGHALVLASDTSHNVSASVGCSAPRQ